MRHKSLDNILIALMSVVALISLFVLYGGRLMSQVGADNTKDTKVASIVEQLQTVKRKRDFYQGWMDAKSGDSLSPNDEIYTHAQSSVKIHFINGPKVSLMENSLLRVKQEGRNAPSLTLERGQLTAKLEGENSKLNLEIGNKKYSFESSSANIQVQQGEKENKFMVLDGSAKFNDSKSNQDIKADQIVVVNIASGQMTVKSIPFKSLLPLHEAVIFFKDSASLNFKWKKQSDSAEGLLQLAKDAGFTEIVASNSASLLELNSELNLPGTYYWKITSDEGVTGPTRTFTLIEEMAPVVNIDKTILYQSSQRPGKVFISWAPEKNSRPAKNYLIKTESAKGLKEYKTSGYNFEWTPGDHGGHSISLKVDDINRKLAMWSDPLKIEVKEEKAVDISSDLPDFIERMTFDSAESTMLLNWNGPQNDFNYTISLIHNKKKTTLLSQTPSHLIQFTDAGLYEWEIQGESPSGVKTNTIKGKILVKKPLNMNKAPSAGTIIELDRPDQLVNFKWKELSKTAAYEFELSKDQSFNEIVQTNEVTNGSHSTVINQIGKYFWRVKIKGKNSTDYSSPVSVELRPSPPLKSPENLPDLNLKLRYQNAPGTDIINIFFNLMISNAHASGSIATTEWDLPANKHARDYIVEIYSDDDNNKDKKKLVVRLESKIPHVVWKNAVPGTFYWQVAYVDHWGRQTEFSKLSLLKTEDEVESKAESKQDDLMTIELVRPPHKEKILQERNDDYEFSWDASDQKDFQFVVATDLDFTRPLIKRKLKQNKIKIKCSQLTPGSGKYYWKILSGKYSSNLRQFRVVCPVSSPLKIPRPKVKIENIVEAKVEATANTVEAQPIKEYLAPKHYAKLSLSPHILSYQNKSTDYTAKVDGLALLSLNFNYHRPVEWKWFQFAEIDFALSRGKVFDTIIYNDFDLTLKLLRNKNSFSWGGMLGFTQKTLYVETDRTITGTAQNYPFLGITIQRETEIFSMNAEIKAGTMLEGSGVIQYKVNNKYAVGPFFSTSNSKKDTGTHSFTQIGLKLDVAFLFDNN